MYSFLQRELIRNRATSVVHCDAGEVWHRDSFSNFKNTRKFPSKYDFSYYNGKKYDIELKSLFSAFGIRSLAVTSLRSLLMFYLPLLESQVKAQDDDEDFIGDTKEENIDLIVPFKKSLTQIVREITVVTSRRVLERLAVHFFSQRVAWKLLKDVPKSAVRKAGRGLPVSVFFLRVCRSTFRGHFLGAAATWLVQTGIETHHYICGILASKQGNNCVGKKGRAKAYGRRVFSVSIRCCSSLVFASVGAGIGSTLVSPSTGQWIGCAVGDVAGTVMVTIWFERVHLDL